MYNSLSLVFYRGIFGIRVYLQVALRPWFYHIIKWATRLFNWACDESGQLYINNIYHFFYSVMYRLFFPSNLNCVTARILFVLHTMVFPLQLLAQWMNRQIYSWAKKQAFRIVSSNPILVEIWSISLFCFVYRAFR